MNAEAKVGALFFVGLAVVIGFTLFVTDVQLASGQYQLLFSATPGLRVGDPVLYNGVRVGSVRSLEPVVVDGETQIQVSFDVEGVDREVVLVNAATSFQINSGVLGGSHLSIGTKGGGVPLDEEVLKDFRGQEPYGLQQALGEIGGVLSESRDDIEKALKGLPRAITSMGDMATEIEQVVAENRERFAKAIEEFAGMSQQIREMVQENRGQVKTAVSEFTSMSSEIRKLIEANRAAVDRAITRFGDMSDTIEKLVAENREAIKAASDRLPDAVKSVDDAASEIRRTVSENRERIDRAIANIEKISEDFSGISGQIASGDGTLGKLVYEDTIAVEAENALGSLNRRLQEVESITSSFSSLRFYIGGSYATQPEDFQGAGSAYLRIEPKPWKFYEGGVTWRTASDERDTLDDDPDDLGIDLDIRLGWRFFPDDVREYYWLSVRGGLFEGQLGVGWDWQLFHPDWRLRTVVRAKDNDREEQDRRYEDGSIMARSWLEWRVWQRVYLIAGGNDLVDDASPWVGIRAEILDQDITSASTAASFAP